MVILVPDITYRRLRSHDNIRLLRLLPADSDSFIRCELFETSLDHATPYEALSYTWGDPTPRQPIILNGSQFAVPVNLHEALLHLRVRTEARVLWIDMLCINQDDLAEKAREVRLMHQIYSRAERVVAWLGGEAEDSTLAISTLKTIYGLEQCSSDQFEDARSCRKGILTLLSTRPVAKSLISLFNRPYWMRGWIVQELVSGSRVIVTCGKDTFHFDVLLSFAMQMQGMRLTTHSQNVKDVSESFLAVAILCNLAARSLDRKSHHDSVGLSTLHYLSTLRFRKTADPRDQVYAYLNISSCEDKAKSLCPIMYGGPVENSYEAFARWHIVATGTLNILHFANHYVTNDDRPWPAPDVASWVADWRNTTRPLNPLPSFKTAETSTYQSSKDSRRKDETSCCRHGLKIRALKIDTIKTLSPVVDSSEMFNIGKASSKIMRKWESIRREHVTNAVYSSTSFELPKELPGDDVRIDEEGLHLNGTRISHSQLAILEAFWRTLIADRFDLPGTQLLRGQEEPGRASGELWYLFINWYSGTAFMPDWQDQRDCLGREKWFADTLFEAAIRNACGMRRFMVTENGYMGLAPAAARAGDLIILAEGAQTPLVLRTAAEEELDREFFGLSDLHDDEKKQYVASLCGGLSRFIGDCYVHGVMDGELWPDEDSDLKDFILV